MTDSYLFDIIVLFIFGLVVGYGEKCLVWVIGHVGLFFVKIFGG
jgi:hypothetical protein